MRIPFNIPYFTGKEAENISDSIFNSNKKDYDSYLSRCTEYLKTKWGYNEVHLTTSCTAALEISAILTGINAGDEVIVPSYTFPSTAMAFIRQGARVVFADSRIDHPGIDEECIENLITDKTRAIILVHYAGVACDMNHVLRIARKYNLLVIEDAAHGFDCYYNDQSLGSIGDIACLSFHSTKNLHCIEGGAIILNDKKFSERISSVIEKGTNRLDFIEGKAEKYEWVDMGSSFKMSELHASCLLPQLEQSAPIKKRRVELWNEYYNSLKKLECSGKFRIPQIPAYADHNAHIFYLILENKIARKNISSYLTDCGIESASHYVPLDTSRYWIGKSKVLNGNYNSLRYGDCLLRLPLFNTMTLQDVKYVTSSIIKYFT